MIDKKDLRIGNSVMRGGVNFVLLFLMCIFASKHTKHEKIFKY